ncbi:type II toxin-antitoxin system prevent-host-death family antitoxin [Nonomuraea sp. B19D2]|uniref:type II toxin-antitoxin system prevent-host-death family antitoxin n=1 Tax=Nonomuraea sp. B19D2 TaxID=3159561 RepID=UPI0032DBB424
MKKIGIRDARARLAELIEAAGGGEPVTLTRRGPGRNEAVLLPVEAAAVWQRHLAEQEAERQRRAQEKALGERLPAQIARELGVGCSTLYRALENDDPAVPPLTTESGGRWVRSG